MIVNYTKTDLQEVKSDLDKTYASLACKAAREVLYKVRCCNTEAMKELFLYKWALAEISINTNGVLDNDLLTMEELTCIAQRINEIHC